MRISDWSSDVCSSDLTIKDGRVEQSNFHDYPAIMLAEVPPVDVFLIPGDQIPGGAGEIGVPVIAPALTASIFALTGIGRPPCRERVCQSVLIWVVAVSLKRH